MSFFTDAEVADFADLVEEASPDTGVVKRRSGSSSDGHGGMTDTYADVATVAVKVAATAGPNEGQTGNALQGDILVDITLPAGTDIQNNDRISVTSEADSSVFVYEVVGVAPRRSFEARRRVTARAIS